MQCCAVNILYAVLFSIVASFPPTLYVSLFHSHFATPLELFRYDANLICPILLASKCVIFNWKGDLQKDHILSTLGIMVCNPNPNPNQT